MQDRWIQGRFEGTYAGDRVPVRADPGGGRRFSFTLQAGRVEDLEFCAAPGPEAPPSDGPKEIRQERLDRVQLPLSMGGENPCERRLFDVRIRDWQLKHPAESKGRAYGTIVGTIVARLTPPAVAPQPMEPVVASEPLVQTEPDSIEAPAARHRGTPPRGSGPSEVRGTDADVIYSRLRWILAALLSLGVAGAIAAACGVRTAGIWAAPVVLAFVLRGGLRRMPTGRRSVHQWAGAAIVAGQAVILLPPLRLWWATGCGPAVFPDFFAVAACVVVAGLARPRWPLLLTSAAWTIAVCATCWELAGACGAPGAIDPPSVPSVHTASPRTDADGRWPVMPSLRGHGLDASGGGSTESAAPPSPSAARPGAEDAQPPGGSRTRGPIELLAPRPTSEQASRAAPVHAEAPRSARSQAATPSPAPRQAPGREPSSTASRSSGPTSVPGGWVAADHRRAQRELVRISIEHANRAPDAFFESDGGRRVYMLTDPIFRDGSAQIRRKGALELGRLAALLNLHPERRVGLEVHTDSGGGLEEQVGLSERRADAVHKWLIDRGHLAPEQLESVGLGGAQPIVPPDGSYAAQQPNRRIEVRLLD